MVYFQTRRVHTCTQHTHEEVICQNFHGVCYSTRVSFFFITICSSVPLKHANLSSIHILLFCCSFNLCNVHYVKNTPKVKRKKHSVSSRLTITHLKTERRAIIFCPCLCVCVSFHKTSPEPQDRFY